MMLGAPMNPRPGRRYHSFAHPEEIYRQAESLGLEYDPALDLAILTHDVVLSHSFPEMASWQWLRRRQDVPDFSAYGLIMSTMSHRPRPDNRMIILDLSGFASDDRRRADTAALREEKHLELGWEREEFDAKTGAYLAGLSARIAHGLEDNRVPPADVALLEAIHSGILKTIEELSAAPTFHL